MITQTINALAFEKKHVNKRPVFSMRQELSIDDKGNCQSTRKWFAADNYLLSEEAVQWQDGLSDAALNSPSLEESCGLSQKRTSENYVVSTTLKSALTKNILRERDISTPHQPVTLSSMPLLIAKNWLNIINGDAVFASYVVLKVQRAATLKIQRVKANNNDSEIIVEVAPTNLLLRLLFGKTTLYFMRDNAPKLLCIEGLLDPRDRKPNGRWHEYFGRIEFSEPWDLSSFVEEK